MSSKREILFKQDILPVEFKQLDLIQFKGGNVYNYFDDFIKVFGSENASEDYWYDIAIFESIEIVNKFNKDDWEKVIQNMRVKNRMWKIRLLESFSNDRSPERIIIASNILEESDDEELLMAAIDYLRDIPISISSALNKKVLQKLNILKEKSKINEMIINKFMRLE